MSSFLALSVEELLHDKERHVLVATMVVHQWQCHMNQDSLVTIYSSFGSRGLTNKSYKPLHSHIRPVQKSVREWRLTVDYHGLNEVTPSLSAAVWNKLEFSYELERQPSSMSQLVLPKHFSLPLWQQSAGHSLLSYD